MTARRSDVVLIHVPFVGAPGGKVRPALIVQDDRLNQSLNETLIAEITTNLQNVRQPHQVLIEVSTTEGSASGLLTNSAVRCNRIHTVPQSSVIRIIGRLSSALMGNVESSLQSALSIP